MSAKPHFASWHKVAKYASNSLGPEVLRARHWKLSRSRITKSLIDEKGFCAVAAEADWPDAYRVNRYARRRADDATGEEALRGFERFPSWMWRNVVVRDFVEWLRAHNRRCEAHRRPQTGFYGLDLYSLHRVDA